MCIFILADGGTPDDVRRCMAEGGRKAEEMATHGDPYIHESCASESARAMEDALAGRPPSPWPGDA